MKIFEDLVRFFTRDIILCLQMPHLETSFCFCFALLKCFKLLHGAFDILNNNSIRLKGLKKSFARKLSLLKKSRFYQSKIF